MNCGRMFKKGQRAWNRDKNGCLVPPKGFEFPLTDAQSWALGVIFGDGSISVKNGVVAIYSGDADVLEQSRVILGGKISYSPNHCPRLSVCSLSFCLWLRDKFFPILPKGNALNFPPTEFINLSGFVRGLIDSDGSWVWRKDKRWSKFGTRSILKFNYCSCSREFVEEFARVLRASLGLVRLPYIYIKQNENPVYQLDLHKADSIALGNLVYWNVPYIPYCSRKYRIWSQWLNEPKYEAWNKGLTKALSGNLITYGCQGEKHWNWQGGISMRLRAKQKRLKGVVI